ncbi:hypothetical protein [Amycolatopsis cihanbeyliensis]|nr:hypothetical protein [Amycolatopsis cihanbeyliensis]
MGPTLAWHRPNKRMRHLTTLGAFGFLVIGGSLLGLLDGDSPFEWLLWWQSWILIIVFTILIGGPFSTIVHSAGADWLQVQRLRWGVTKSNFVKLYELTKIDVSHGGTTFHLYLSDGERAVERSFEELQVDRRVWDLVYNGVLHSVASGATVTTKAAGILELSHVPGLKFRNPYTEGGK